MRISDWSSDVCSSDLFDIALDLIGLADRELEIAALHAGIERLVRDHRRGALGGGFLLGGHLSLHPLPGKIAGPGCGPTRQGDRKSVVSGKSVSVRVDLGGRRIIKKKNNSKAVT